MSPSFEGVNTEMIMDSSERRIVLIKFSSEIFCCYSASYGTKANSAVCMDEQTYVCRQSGGV